MANEPTFNPNAYRDSQETERRNRAVQDLYEPGSTFKVVTASAAIEEKVMPLDTMIDTNPGRLYVAGRSRLIIDDAGRNNGVLSFTDVIVKSSNIGAIKIGLRVGAERLSRYVGLYGFGKHVSPDFPGGELRHRLEPRQAERERARVDLDGLSGGDHAAADGGGGQLGRQRRPVRRAARDARDLPQRGALPGCAESGAPHGQPRHRGRPDHDHGRGRHRRHGQARRHRRLHRRRQDRHRAEAGQRPVLAFRSLRVVRRLRAVAPIRSSRSSS